MKTCRTGKVFHLVLSGLCLIFALVGCSSGISPTPSLTQVPFTQEPAKVGGAGNATVTVRQLIDNGDAYAGQMLSLNGKIVLECPEGCWFFLDDGTGKIYVDLKPAGLVIPQKVGSRIALKGKTKGSGGNLQILGEEVQFIDE